MAYGVAGFSVAVDSLSAIKYAKVKPVRGEDGITTDFEIEGEYPQYGNDDDRVDKLGEELLQEFYNDLSEHPCYRKAHPTLSVLTITSNVVYGEEQLQMEEKLVYHLPQELTQCTEEINQELLLPLILLLN